MRQILVVTQVELRRLLVHGVALWLLLGTWFMVFLPLVFSSDHEKGYLGDIEEAKFEVMDQQDFVIAAPAEFLPHLGDRPIRVAPSSSDEWDAKIVRYDERIEILWDHRVERSERASLLAEEVAEAWAAAELAARARAAGLPEDPRNLVTVTYEAVDDGGRGERERGFASLFLWLVLAVVLPSSYVAADVYAGDRERGTLETILVTRVAHHAVQTGKWLAAVIVSTLGGWGVVAIATVVDGSGWAQILEVTDAQRWTMAGVGLLATPWLALLVTTGAALAFRFVASYRAASLASLPLVFVVSLLGAAGGVSSLKSVGFMALVPVSNVALLARDLVMGQATWMGVGFVLAVVSLQVWLGLRWASRHYLGERALFGAEVSTAPGSHPTGRILWLAAVATTLMWTLGATAQAVNLAAGLVFAEVLLLGGVAWAATRWLELSVTEVLSVRRPLWRDVGLAVALGSCLWGVTTIVQVAQDAWLPVAFQGQETLTMTFLAGRPWWSNLILVGLIPAVFEELMFRGVLLGMMRGSWRPSVAIVVNGALFGLIHFDLVRILPTAAIGVFAAAAVWRTRSIWVGVVVHATNNSLAVVLFHLGMLSSEQSSSSLMFAIMPAVLSVACLAMMSVGGSDETS